MAENTENEDVVQEESDALDGTLRMRVLQKELDIFMKKSPRITGKPYQMLIREFITAFNDGRLTIIATEEQKEHLGNLYK